MADRHRHTHSMKIALCQSVVYVHYKANRVHSEIELNWKGFLTLCNYYLPLKRQSRLQQATVLNVFSLFFFSEKIRLDVSSESIARQRIHMKHQALFSSIDKSKKNKMSFAAIFCLVL